MARIATGRTLVLAIAMVPASRSMVMIAVDSASRSMVMTAVVPASCSMVMTAVVLASRSMVMTAMVLALGVVMMETGSVSLVVMMRQQLVHRDVQVGTYLEPHHPHHQRCHSPGPAVYRLQRHHVHVA